MLHLVLVSEVTFNALLLQEFHRSGGSRIVVQHTLPLVVFTRFIRFHPIKQHKWNCLRVEVYSSKGKTVK